MHVAGLSLCKEGVVKRTAIRFLAVLAALGALVAATSEPAEAHSRSRFFFGFNFGAPCCYYGPHYYAPAYYYPPPYYYYYPPPPPVVYAPPPAYYAPPPAPTNNCRDYRGDATVDGSRKPFYGRACLESDGKWHVVN